MGGSVRSSDDGALGCAVLLGVALAVLVGWLAWLAVLWFAADWRWAWITATAPVVPVVAYGVIVAWREPQPFVPSERREAWCSAVAVAVGLLAPMLVLVKGWGTAGVALIAGVSICAFLGRPHGHFEFPQLLPPVEGVEGAKKPAGGTPDALSDGQL
jgi:hypothetical protein